MSSKITILSAAALSVGFAVTTASAVPIAVPNFSFEDPNVADGGFTDDAPPGWSAAGSADPNNSSGVEDPDGNQFPGTAGEGAIAAPGNGTQYAYINSNNNDTNFITSDVLATVQPSTTYTLTVAIGDRADGPDPRNVLIALLVDGAQPLGAATATTGAALVDGVFTDFTATFTTTEFDALVGGNLSVRLTQTGDGTNSPLPQVNFDNVRLDATAVPEPTGLALLGVGACALLRRQGRRVG